MLLSLKYKFWNSTPFYSMYTISGIFHEILDLFLTAAFTFSFLFLTLRSLANRHFTWGHGAFLLLLSMGMMMGIAVCMHHSFLNLRGMLGLSLAVNEERQQYAFRLTHDILYSLFLAIIALGGIRQLWRCTLQKGGRPLKILLLSFILLIAVIAEYLISYHYLLD